MRHKPSRKPSSLVFSLFPNNKSLHCFLIISLLTFFLVGVKMNLETKVIGFQFEPERSICNHKGFFQDWSETCLTGKIATLAFGGSVGTAPQ